MTDPERARHQLNYSHDDPSRSLTSEYLATPIGLAITVRPDEVASEAAERLGIEYDQAPVKSRGRYVGYVLTSELATHPGRVEDVMHERGADVTVAASAPIRDVIPVLHKHRFVFVRNGKKISGFITISDLNKHAARAYFYLLIAGLEIALAELIRDTKSIAEQEALARKLPDRGYEVRGRYLVDKSEGREVDYVAYMGFTELMKVIGLDRSFLRAVGASSADGWLSTVGGLPQLRNAVMHATRELVSDPGDVARLIRQETLIRRTLTRLRDVPANQPRRRHAWTGHRAEAANV